MSDKGYVCGLKKKDANKSYNSHRLNIEWEPIPMLSVLTGKNGSGKSTILKMFLPYFNRLSKKDYKTGVEKLDYEFILSENIKADDVLITLIHFDNTRKELKSRVFTNTFYNVKSLPIHKTFNFSNELNKLSNALIAKTSLDNYNEKNARKGSDFDNSFSYAIKRLKEDLSSKMEILFPKLKDVDSRILFLKEYLDYTEYKYAPYTESIENICNILVQNMDLLDKINKELKDNEFKRLIDVKINSQIVFDSIEIKRKKTSQNLDDLDQQQQVILYKCLVEKSKDILDNEYKKSKYKLKEIFEIDFKGQDFKSDWDLIEKELDLREQIIAYEVLFPIKKFWEKIYLKNEMDDMNETLKNEGFKYKLSFKLYFDLLFTQNPSFNPINEMNNKCFDNIDTLTNGEQIIFLSLLWKVLSENERITKNEKKQVLLIDEIDAHMHPGAVHKLVKSIKLFVEKSKIQVILTTHNPTTVSFFDEKNLFLIENKNSENKIVLKSGVPKQRIVYNLTSKLVQVNFPFKTLYVEGNLKENSVGNDVKYYKTVCSILNQNECYKIPFHFEINISNFKKGTNNKTNLIINLRGLQLPNIYGLVDNDGDSDCEIIEYVDNLFYLKRHSLENYVLDPINVYFYFKKTEIAKELVTKIQDRIKNELKQSNQNKDAKNYNDYCLSEIIISIYSNNDIENCINILQIIIDEFYNFMVDECVNKLVNGDFTSCSLFNLPKYSINKNKKQSLKNDFNRNEVIDKLYEDFTKSSKCLNKINLSKIVNSIEKIEKDLQQGEKNPKENFKSKFEDIFKSVSRQFKKVEENFRTTNKFDLKVLTNKQSLSNYDIKIDGNNIIQEDYSRLEKLINTISTIQKYQNIQTLTELSDEDKIKKVKEKLGETRDVYINNSVIKHRNMFINVNMNHILDTLYNIKFQNCGINCSNLIKSFESNDIFIPDDLVYLFRNLCNNIVELDQNTFDQTVYNANQNWFIKFTNTDEKNIDEKFLKM